MGEINAAEQVGKIFEQAQRLMKSRQQLVTAQMEADAAERELTRLNGSTNLDLSRFERLRFFECEGPAALAVLDDSGQEKGATPAVPPMCTNIVQLSSWEIDHTSKRPEKAPVCDECAAAIRRATPPKQAEEAKATEAKAKATEIPF